MSYRFVRDEDNGMSSFSRVTPASSPPPDLYQIRWTDGAGNTGLVDGGLDEITANMMAGELNRAARGLVTNTVEPLDRIDYTPWREFIRDFHYPGPANVTIRYDENGGPVLVSVRKTE